MLTGVFGGAFDPVHIGHLNLANNILKRADLDKILFIPTARPPHKPNTPVTCFVHRYKMVQAAVADNKFFEVSDIENRDLSKPSYSVNTIKKLKKIYSSDNFRLIIGCDSLKMLHTWYKAEELTRICSIISYPRPGSSVSLEGLKKYWPEKTAEDLYNSILDLPPTDISSTEIRRSFYAKPSIRQFLPSAVSSYIIKNGLYKK
ncbi:MAG: nicotinate-nucleotide adenylyltransferase [Victivallales bacterium]|nr:nicotinate-nucleotide adenylyltransferase [Victivallales bacterium]